jgi:hypothetical protein
MSLADRVRGITIGYPKLAAVTELQPEVAIYRRFGALNALNVLYLQAELEDLEEKLRAQQAKDDSDPMGKKSLYAKTWFRLKDSAFDGDTEQLHLVMKIRETLKEYSKQVLNAREIFTYSLKQIMPLSNNLQYSIIPSPGNGTWTASSIVCTPKRWDLLHYSEEMQQSGAPSLIRHRIGLI